MEHIFRLRRRHAIEIALTVVAGIAMLLIAFGPTPLGAVAFDRELSDADMAWMLPTFALLVATAVGLVASFKRAEDTMLTLRAAEAQLRPL